MDWFLWLLLVVSFLIPLLFLVDRRRSLQDQLRPLNLRAQSRSNSQATLDPATREVIKWEMIQPRSSELQIFFNHNGHTFEAYEVLGLPAGSPWDRVQKCYAQMAPAQRTELIQRAYELIEQKYR